MCWKLPLTTIRISASCRRGHFTDCLPSRTKSPSPRRRSDSSETRRAGESAQELGRLTSFPPTLNDYFLNVSFLLPPSLWLSRRPRPPATNQGSPLSVEETHLVAFGCKFSCTNWYDLASFLNTVNLSDVSFLKTAGGKLLLLFLLNE